MFQKFPALQLVLIESGFTWLPNLLWRTSKTWRGVRPEVPWIDRSPAEIIREHVRLTLQPVDAPPGDTRGARAHAGTHRFRPHAAVLDRLSALAIRRRESLPDGLSDETVRRILIDNPLETYPRLREGAQIGDNAVTSKEAVR